MDASVSAAESHGVRRQPTLVWTLLGPVALLAQVAFDHPSRLRAAVLLLLSRDTLVRMRLESKSLTYGRFCKRRREPWCAMTVVYGVRVCPRAKCCEQTLHRSKFYDSDHCGELRTADIHPLEYACQVWLTTERFQTL